MRVFRTTLMAWMSLVLLLAAVEAGPGELGRGRDIHFRGPIFTISRDPSGNTVQLTIGVNNGQVDVMVNSWTEVIIGRGFTADRTRLVLGDFVEISGFFTTSGTVVAQRIHVESRDAIDLQGRIDAVSDNLIQVDGLDLLADADSLIEASGSHVASSVAALSVGQEVRVRARADNGSWRILQLEYGPRTVDSEPLRLEGIFLGFYDYGNGATNKNLLMIDVGIRSGGKAVGTPVARTQDTIVEGDLSPGRLVQIEWTFSRSPGNQLLPVASHIVVDSNSNDNVFDDSAADGDPVECELKGPIHGLGPGSGGLQFYIQETLVRLNAQTQVRYQHGSGAAVSDLADGVEVEVTGVRLQDRTVQASSIEIRQDADSDETSGDTNENPGDGTGGDPGSGPETPGDSQPDDSGNGSGGDSGGNPPSGDEGGSTEPGGPGSGSDEHESSTVEISGVISELHRLEDETVNRITVDSIVIDVTPQTVIEGGASEESDSSVLAVGQTVAVQAVERTDGSVFAKKISIKD